MKLPKLLQSSANPENLSLSIKGFLVMLVPTILAISGVLGWSLTEGDILEVINAIVATIGGMFFLYGVARKVYYYFVNKRL